MKINVHKNTFTRIFREAFLIIARNQKDPSSLLVGNKTVLCLNNVMLLNNKKQTSNTSNNMYESQKHAE